MATKRNTKAVKRAKKVKDLSLKSTQAKGVKGGFQWGVGRKKWGGSAGGDNPQ